MKNTNPEALQYKFQLEEHLVTVKSLMKQMDVVYFDPTLTEHQKMEELKKIREELSKVALEIDNVKKGIKLLTTRHLN